MNLITLGLLFASVIAGAIIVEIFKPEKSQKHPTITYF